MENKWVSYSKKIGVILNPSKENNDYLTNIFNVKEVQNLVNFLDLLDKNRSDRSD